MAWIAVWFPVRVLLSRAGCSNGPAHDSGQGVTPAYEGWFANPDGTFSILFGYFNRNQKQELDIPVGPDNRIEPGGPDQGQPTHFLPKRQWGVFTVTVPKDFGAKKLTWTLVANGKTTNPAGLDPLMGAGNPFQGRDRQYAALYRLHAPGPFREGSARSEHTSVATAPARRSAERSGWPTTPT